MNYVCTINLSGSRIILEKRERHTHCWFALCCELSLIDSLTFLTFLFTCSTWSSHYFRRTQTHAHFDSNSITALAGSSPASLAHQICSCTRWHHHHHIVQFCKVNIHFHRLRAQCSNRQSQRKTREKGKPTAHFYWLVPGRVFPSSCSKQSRQIRLAIYWHAF